MDPAGEGEELPAYFGTYETGALAESFAAFPFGTYANLVTFESDDVIDDYVDQYDAYEDEGGGDLALVVVPTQDGLPVDADDEQAVRADGGGRGRGSEAERPAGPVAVPAAGRRPVGSAAR